MNGRRFCIHVFVFLTTFALVAPPVLGEELFHNGGTGACQGCHSNPPELISFDASSTCLRCHLGRNATPLGGQHHIATDTSLSPFCIQMPPSGDFCWLKKNYSWAVEAQPSMLHSEGQDHGHNIVALEYGYGPDSTSAWAPGGSYPAANLSCISCHDPHGRYRRLEDGSVATEGPPVIASGSYTESPDPSPTGSVGVYRLLAGKGYQPKSVPGAPLFNADPPLALSPVQYNRAETASDTRVVYGSGMSEWCQNCHPQMNSYCTHPAGGDAQLSHEVIDNYNSYIASGNLTGNYYDAYNSLVPYETGSGDYSSLKMTARTIGRSGPSGGENVMCLSCHRAHASGWDSMLRWNMQATFIVYGGVFPGIDNNTPSQLAQGRTAAETQKALYDRLASSFAQFQRNYCNKCHARD